MIARAGEAFRAAWPLAGIGLAVAVNGVWIGALGYGISKLFWSSVSIMKRAFQWLFSFVAAGMVVVVILRDIRRSSRRRTTQA
jgi:zinc transporter ZupT